MIRRHENPQAIKAGLLALLVHALFFMLLVMSFDWKSEMPLQVTEVELWDSLPTPAPQPLPLPEPPKPEPKVEPEPTPPPPPPEPKAEIVVKEKKPEPKPEKKKEEPPKPDPAIKKKQEELKKKAEEKKRQEELRKLQQEMLKDDLAQDALDEEARRLEAARNARASAASSGVVDEYRAKIKNKIYSWMNRQSCGSAVPEYSISVMPTGQVSGTPKLVKSSGIPACDDAALRAIMQAQPLPIPPDPELFAKFRDLTIPFKPEQ